MAKDPEQHSLILKDGRQLSLVLRAWERYQRGPLLLRVITPLVTFAVAGWLWDRAITLLGQAEYAAAMILTIAFLVIGVCSALLIRRKVIKFAAIFLVTVVSLYTVLIILQAKGNRSWTTIRLFPTPERTTTPTPDPTPDESVLRRELRNQSFRPLRDVAFRIKMNRRYPIADIGHFRIIFEIFDNDALDWFMACQDFYRPTYDPKINPHGAKSNVYGYRCVVQYRTPKKTYTVIPLYPADMPRRYTSLLTGDATVETLDWQIDLYNQIPSYKTLEDLNRKNLYIFVTESISDKISRISFEANGWELISAPANKLAIIDDIPIAPWFLPLSKSEQAVKWKGIYLKAPDEIPPSLRDKPMVWPLDFAMIHPRKLPEPEIKVDVLK